jgi:phage head maturation protease
VTAAELREITVTSMPAYPESGVEIAHRSLFPNILNCAALAITVAAGLN